MHLELFLPVIYLVASVIITSVLWAATDNGLVAALAFFLMLIYFFR